MDNIFLLAPPQEPSFRVSFRFAPNDLMLLASNHTKTHTNMKVPSSRYQQRQQTTLSQRNHQMAAASGDNNNDNNNNNDNVDGVLDELDQLIGKLQ